MPLELVQEPYHRNAMAKPFIYCMHASSYHSPTVDVRVGSCFI